MMKINNLNYNKSCLILVYLSILLTVFEVKAQKFSSYTLNIENLTSIERVDELTPLSEVKSKESSFDQISVVPQFTELIGSDLSSKVGDNFNPLKNIFDFSLFYILNDSLKRDVKKKIVDLQEKGLGNPLVYLAKRVIRTKIKFGSLSEVLFQARHIQSQLFRRAQFNCQNQNSFCSAKQMVPMPIKDWKIKYKSLYSYFNKAEFGPQLKIPQSLLSVDEINQMQFGFIQVAFDWSMIFSEGVNIVLLAKESDGTLKFITYQIFRLNESLPLPRGMLLEKIQQSIDEQIKDLMEYLNNKS